MYILGTENLFSDWESIVFGFAAGILYIFMSRKTYTINSDSSIEVEKDKMDSWNRYHRIYHCCSGINFTAVTIFEMVGILFGFEIDFIYPIGISIMIVFYLLRHLNNVRVFGKIFVRNILKEVK